ncbi:MAG: YdcF family protein [Negativicutes bacterium]
MDRVNELALTLWDYLKLNHDMKKADAIIVFGNHDLLTAVRGIELYKENFAPLLIFTGALGRVTEGVWEEPEAQKFSKMAISTGIDRKNIRIEDKSTNTGENIIYTKRMLAEENLPVASIIAVHKPYMERRVYAALRCFWPEIDVVVSSPQLSFRDYLTALTMQGFSEKHTIEMIVGDFQRVDLYAKKGYQIPQAIPQCAEEAYHELVRLGYNKYVIG